jgi:hypothetical protein
MEDGDSNRNLRMSRILLLFRPISSLLYDLDDILLAL